MKTTAFNRKHKEYGARLVEFAGFEMPVEYSGVISEHLAVRNSAGVFDVSHMGEIWVKGPNARKLLDYILSNDPGLLIPGKAQYTCFPNGRGGIVDDLIVHLFPDGKYLLVVNASNIEKDWNWINSQNKFGADLENASDRMSQLAIQGPEATKVLQKLTDVDLASMPSYSFVIGTVGGIKNILIASTGYTGSGGFEIYTDSPDPSYLWDRIFDAGREFEIKPIGLAARDTLRLEMGYCLYGNDINEVTSPIEAGLGWITKFNEGRNFIDRDLLLRQKIDGVSRKLTGFEMIDRGIPRQHYKIHNATDEEIGEVTSGTMAPSLKKGIGMGYLKTQYTSPGTEIYISIRDKKVPAKVVKMPFV
ncbi:MAG TPA: glycine cleavage system aminomethyltransferase GcvT [Bacteroidales bacterium]|jgi:aminomethyltransferase|nr:glycine cleavage system aminomethyltransferase GcvT [Bacteroidales bacterium]